MGDLTSNVGLKPQREPLIRPNQRRSFWELSPGAENFLFCDGTFIFCLTLPTASFRALCTRSGNETINPEW